MVFATGTSNITNPQFLLRVIGVESQAHQSVTLLVKRNYFSSRTFLEPLLLPLTLLIFQILPKMDFFKAVDSNVGCDVIAVTL